MSSEKKEVTLSEFIIHTVNFIKYLFKKKIAIIAICFLGGCLGILKAYLTKPVYISKLTFVTEGESSGSVGAYAGIAAQFGIDLGGGGNGAFEGENLIEMLKSQTLIYKTLFSEYNNETKGDLLIDKYLENREIKKAWQNNPALKSINFKNGTGKNRTADSVLQVIYKGIIEGQLTVDKIDKKLNFVFISMKDENEEFAKKFVETLAQNAINYYTDYKSSKSKLSVEILQKQADSLRSILFGSIEDIAVISDLNVNPMRSVMRTGVQRKQVDVQTSAALYTEILKNLQISKIALRKETPFIQVIDAPLLPLEKKKPGRLFTGIAFAIITFFICVIFYLVKYNFKKIKYILQPQQTI